MTSRRARPSVRSTAPTLREERRLLRSGHVVVAGMDEVGRGALAGPVTVGLVVVDATVRTAPSGVRDSKLLTPAAREAMVPRLRRWALEHAVGHAQPDEIDRYGIIAALRLAGRRALAQLPLAPTCVLLDGCHDWLTLPDEPVALFELDVAGRSRAPVVELSAEPAVLTRVKADQRCAAVAAASVLAKVERDAIMVRLAEDFPAYGWRENKGYSAPEHAAALRAWGPCSQHRQSWSLPLGERDPDVELADADQGGPGGAGNRGPAGAGNATGNATGAGEDPWRREPRAVRLRHHGAVAR
jgi:ribonuclease HII